MLCIGVDFGSTYTTVSVYQEETGKLEAQTLSEGGTPFIPSVVSVSKGQISVGREAKMMSMMGKKGIQNFRAFKMMLAEENEEVLTDRGFTATYTPEHVTADFLENILKQVLDNIGETKIDHLVLGVPEIWNSTLTTIDGRSRLRDICRRFSFVEKSGVQVVSEPAAASAFFAYNFRQMVGDNFDGKILLVDYGGGTLDITLNEVDVRPDKNGQEGMEIRILYRTGAGENEQRQIGKASIVYMESLLESAIHQEFPNMKIEHDVHFYRALDGLEVQLQECTNIIKTIFDDYGTDPEDLSEDEMDEEDYIFTMIPYRGMFINISYQLMVQVYDQIIRGVFDEKMDGIVYAVCVSLGFAAFENILYLFSDTESFLSIGIVRAIFAVPGHFCFGILMGYYYSIANFYPKSSIKNKILVLLAPIIAHGLYDSILFVMNVTPIISGLLLIVFLVFCHKMWKYSSQRIEKHLKRDQID